jgi:hypothetical protein
MGNREWIAPVQQGPQLLSNLFNFDNLGGTIASLLDSEEATKIVEIEQVWEKLWLLLHGWDSLPGDFRSPVRLYVLYWLKSCSLQN